MTRRPLRNVSASVRTRLLNRSREKDEDFQFLLQRYAAERFLHRLGESEHRSRLVLKGAMLLALWGESTYRPTRDLDSDEDRDGFVRQAQREGMTLSEWFRTAAHERPNHQQRAGSFASTAEIDAFFLECDDLPGPSSEPNWGEYLNVIDGSRRRGPACR